MHRTAMLLCGRTGAASSCCFRTSSPEVLLWLEQLLLATGSRIATIFGGVPRTGHPVCLTDPTCKARGKDSLALRLPNHFSQRFLRFCNPSASQHCDQTLLWVTIKYFTIKRKEIRLCFCNFQSLCKRQIQSNCFNPTDAELRLSSTNTPKESRDSHPPILFMPAS